MGNLNEYNKVTIGIPTYNRASLLEEAVESVLRQSFRDIHIIISDNNSTDNTEQVVKELQERSSDIKISYIKQTESIPVVDNWLVTLNKANSVYFGWLQDDDLIAPDFVETAVQSMEEIENATVYCCYSQYSENPVIKTNISIFGNPFNFNWIKNEKKVLDGHSLIPLSVFDVLGYSPVALFDSKRLRDCSNYITKDYWLISERMIMIQASLGSKMIYDAKIGGLFRSHPEQRSFIYNNKKELDGQKERYLTDLDRIYSELGDIIFEKFEEHLNEIELSRKVKWRINSIGTRNLNDVTAKAFSVLDEHLKKEKKSNPTYFLKLRVEKLKKIVKTPYHHALSSLMRLRN